MVAPRPVARAHSVQVPVAVQQLFSSQTGCLEEGGGFRVVGRCRVLGLRRGCASSTYSRKYRWQMHRHGCRTSICMPDEYDMYSCCTAHTNLVAALHFRNTSCCIPQDQIECKCGGTTMQTNCITSCNVTCGTKICLGIHNCFMKVTCLKSACLTRLEQHLISTSTA